GTNTARLAELVAAFPETRFAALVEDPAVAERLNRTFAKCGLQLDVLVDIDTGMHRTGIAPDRRAVELYRQVNSLPALRPRGLHFYDGQNHMPSPQERSRAVEQICQKIQQLLAAIRGAGFDVQELVCGGTPTFPMFADVSIEGYAGALECSPGTCVLSDANYAQAFPDLGDFQFAALLLTRVISKQHAGQVTLDLGNKAVAADPPLDRRVFLPRLPDARILGHNEEHMIVQSAAADNLDLGDTLIAIPGHVCPTVALHECFQLVEGGRITDQWPITARRRDYRLAGNVEASC
ncbi:MAG: D-TA family PLP-dependent enzyme, partial [Planctomycetota bacterium]